MADVAAGDPRCLQAWADLAEDWGSGVPLSSTPTPEWATTAVWTHSGPAVPHTRYVRWRHEADRGFLRSLDALREAAQAIGEVDEEQRCDLFLRQLDPEWGSRGA